MTDERAAQLLTTIPEAEFLREQNVEDKFDPVKAERKTGQGIVEITRDTKPGVLTGIDRPYYQNVYPMTVVGYDLSETQLTLLH